MPSPLGTSSRPVVPGPVCGLNTTGWADPSPWLAPLPSTKPRWEGKGRFHFSSRTFSALSNSSRGGPVLQTHRLSIQLPRPPNDHSLLDGVRAHTGVPPPPTQATQGTPSASSMVSGNVLFLLGKTALILKTTYSHIWQALHPYRSPGRREQSGDSTPILQTRELSTLRVCVRADVKPRAHPWGFTKQGLLPATNRAWAQGPRRGPKVHGQSRGKRQVSAHHATPTCTSSHQGQSEVQAPGQSTQGPLSHYSCTLPPDHEHRTCQRPALGQVSGARPSPSSSW